MIVYLHGFNSSPLSHKARLLRHHLETQGLGANFRCPALPVLARDAVAVISALIDGARDETICLVGSSLGGFYATYFAETQRVRAVLMNPAIDPHAGLRAYLGPQKNLHSGEPYELTEAHLRDWAALYRQTITPQRYMLIVETGDELLDYRKALKRYAGAAQIVLPGGDHSLKSFPQHLARIVRFASPSG